LIAISLSAIDATIPGAKEALADAFFPFAMAKFPRMALPE
jgi:hypothetical protein